MLKSPGLLSKHYAPRAPMVVRSWRNDEELRRVLAHAGVPLDRVFVVAHTRIPSGAGLGRVSVIPHDPAAYARAIYAELHRCDEGGAALIVVEALPPESEWKPIADRLTRTAAQSES